VSNVNSSITSNQFKDIDSKYNLNLKKNSRNKWLDNQITKVKEVLYSCSDDTTARAFDVETGKCIMIYQGHTDKITQIILSNDSLILFTCSQDLTIKS